MYTYYIFDMEAGKKVWETVQRSDTKARESYANTLFTEICPFRYQAVKATDLYEV